MSRGDAFSGIAPESPPGARSWRQRLLRRSFFRNSTQLQDFGPAHMRSAIVVHFFARGELDGAEGIDGAET
jgi:hypothetical protein